MKKIIATVLAMVMALALCTVAFADDTYTLVYAENPNETWKVSTAISVTNASTTTTDGVVSGKVAVYGFSTTIDKASGACDYTSFVESSAENAQYILYKNGAHYKYLQGTTTAGAYNYVGTVYTTFGAKCGDMAKVDKVNNPTFFTANDGATTTNYYVEDSTNGSIYLLVNNELVRVKLAVKGTDYTVNAHKFTKADGATFTFNTDGTLATAKCATCGAVYTYTKYFAVADAAKDSVAIAAGQLFTGSPVGYLYTNDGTTAGTTTGNTTSPKTFDAGIAMYVGMALTSVAGSAVVIGKKKEF